jgi:hypothetical protein
MRTFIDPSTFPLPGAQLQQAFADDESIDTDSPQLDLFDPDDPLPF